MADEPKITIEFYGNIISRSMITDRWFPRLFFSFELSIDESPWKNEEISEDRCSTEIGHAKKY